MRTKILSFPVQHPMPAPAAPVVPAPLGTAASTAAVPPLPCLGQLLLISVSGWADARMEPCFAVWLAPSTSPTLPGGQEGAWGWSPVGDTLQEQPQQ